MQFHKLEPWEYREQQSFITNKFKDISTEDNDYCEWKQDGDSCKLNQACQEGWDLTFTRGQISHYEANQSCFKFHNWGLKLECKP